MASLYTGSKSWFICILSFYINLLPTCLCISDYDLRASPVSTPPSSSSCHTLNTPADSSQTHLQLTYTSHPSPCFSTIFPSPILRTAASIPFLAGRLQASIQHAYRSYTFPARPLPSRTMEIQ